MDCETIPGPGLRGRASEIATNLQETQPSYQSETLEPVTSHRQASPLAEFKQDNDPCARPLTTQDVLNSIAQRYLQNVNPSSPEEFNGFLKYLAEVRKVLVVDKQQGSLIITLECRSLQILDELWEDYCSGYLNKMAQKFLVTGVLLEEFGLTTVKLKTMILKEEYTACRQYFLQRSGEIEKLYNFLLRN